MKVIHVSNFATEPTFTERINREVEILRRLRGHEFIINLVDVEERLPESIHIVLQLCEGGELYDRIIRLHHYPEEEAKLCCHNLLQAVSYIHARGIMHRDLKPENIMLDNKESNIDLKISDFGFAKVFPRGWYPEMHSCCGTTFYVAPEIIKCEEYSCEVDMWAVGVITYVLLTGTLPFFNSDVGTLYKLILQRDLKFTDRLWAEISREAVEFILQALEVDPMERLTAEQALVHEWISSPVGIH